MKHIALCLTTIMLLTLYTRAAITYVIDPTGKTITFTGSDSGTPESPFGDGTSYVYWQSGATSGIPDYVSLSSAFAGTNFSFATLVVYPTSTDGLFIDLNWETEDPVSISGTGIAISYADLSPASQSILEATTAFTAMNGSGFSSFDAVPEPSGFAITLVFFAGLLLRRGRRILI